MEQHLYISLAIYKTLHLANQNIAKLILSCSASSY